MCQLQSLLKSGIVFTPAVVGYLVKDSKVLLGLRKRVSLGLGKDLIAGLGGKIGDILGLEAETADQALERELLEEVNVVIKAYRKVGRVRFIFPHKPKWNQDVVVYLVDAWEGVPQETEVINPAWFDITELPVTRMWDDNQLWLPRVLSGDNVNATFLFDENSKVIEYIFE